MLAAPDDPNQSRLLQSELVATVNTGEPFVKATYPVADLRFFKGGFSKVRAYRWPKHFAEPRPLSIKNCILFGKFADLATLFALRCEAECILARWHSAAAEGRK